MRPDIAFLKGVFSAVALIIALAGCGVITYTEAGELPPGLAGKLTALRERNATAPLADLTEFTWDTVFYFPEYTAASVWSL